MGIKKQTTVNLTITAQAVKDRLYPAIDLKGLLSAALVCFDQTVPDGEKIMYVNTVLAADSAAAAPAKSARLKRQKET